MLKTPAQDVSRYQYQAAHLPANHLVTCFLAMSHSLHTAKIGQRGT